MFGDWKFGTLLQKCIVFRCNGCAQCSTTNALDLPACEVELCLEIGSLEPYCKSV
jgi:hypothetical protein